MLDGLSQRRLAPDTYRGFSGEINQAAKILHQSLIERFVPVTDEHYEDIYRMFTLVQAQEISPILNPNRSKVV